MRYQSNTSQKHVGDACTGLFEGFAASIRGYGLDVPVSIAPEADPFEDVRFLVESKVLIAAVPGVPLPTLFFSPRARPRRRVHTVESVPPPHIR